MKSIWINTIILVVVTASIVCTISYLHYQEMTARRSIDEAFRRPPVKGIAASASHHVVKAKGRSVVQKVNKNASLWQSQITSRQLEVFFLKKISYI